LDFVINSALRNIFILNPKMRAEIYLTVCLLSQQLPVAALQVEIFGKNTVSENKLCSVFVVNAVKRTF